jgi:hypothetical protein
MSWWSRLRGEQELFITNPLGAEDAYAVGKILDRDDGRWEVTRHHWVMPRDAPWASVHVYGRRA